MFAVLLEGRRIDRAQAIAGLDLDRGVVSMDLARGWTDCIIS